MSARAWALALLLLAGPAHAARKQLIEFGWDEPDTRFLRTQTAQLLASPFDGCVYHVTWHGAAGDSGDLAWDLWGRRRFTEHEVAEANADLRGARLGRFTTNFLRINVTPGTLDWFASHDAVMANLTLAARLARLAGGPGICFDTEPYRDSLWDARVQSRRTGRDWNALAAQARRRGGEAMRALERGYPGLTVFFTMAYSISLDETQGARVPLSQTRYALLPPFLDGMLSAASRRVVFVEGHEASYPYREARQFAAKADSMRDNVLRLTREPARYARHLSVGFGLWLDHDSQRVGWDTRTLTNNHFTPEQFGIAAQAALDHADRYVWIYSEQPRWWSPEGGPRNLPAGYDSVLRALRR